MKKIIIIILLGCFYAKDHSIALVLSGGGAKGVAQIPILHVLDSLNIPIDFVVGTSIGSIGGGFYSIGYSPDEISKIIFNTDWEVLTANKKTRRNLSYFQKNNYQKFQLLLTLDKLKPKIPIALNNGHETFLYINKLIRHNETNDNYDNFVIPFRCNATNLLTGEEIIYSNGSLTKALRSSSSIPAVFTPIIDGDKLLVDGGVLNNLGTDIAKKLGANIILAVNVSSPKTNKQYINDVFDVLSQSILLNGLKKKNNNIKLATLLIEPDLQNYSMLDFSQSSIKMMYKEGYKAAYENIEKLQNIKLNLLNTNNKNIKLSGIESDSINIVSSTIESKSINDINNIFPFDLPQIFSRNNLVNFFLSLRKSNKYNNINFSFNKVNNGYKIIINLEKNRPIIINNIFIEGSNKISSSFINRILNISKNDSLDYNRLEQSISKLYHTDFFESIQYELINLSDQQTDIKIIVNESNFKQLRLGSSWSNYYQLIGKLQLDLINKPFTRFRIQNKLIVGNSLKENHLKLLYTGKYIYKTAIMPQIKFYNKKNKSLYYNQLNEKLTQNTKDKQESIGLLFSLKQFGFLEINSNNQTITYENSFKEIFGFFDLQIELDQLDDILYPTKGYKINYYYEKSFKDTSYIINKIYFDHFIKLASRNSIRFFSNYSFSENINSIYKNINFLTSNKSLTYNEYDLYSTNFLLYGMEINYLYRESQTLRILLNNIDNVQLNNNNRHYDLFSYGLGLRIKSFLGPINFLWTKGDGDIFSKQKIENYYFSIGIDY